MKMYIHNFMVYFTELNMEVEPKPLLGTKMGFGFFYRTLV